MFFLPTYLYLLFLLFLDGAYLPVLVLFVVVHLPLNRIFIFWVRNLPSETPNYTEITENSCRRRYQGQGTGLRGPTLHPTSASAGPGTAPPPDQLRRLRAKRGPALLNTLRLPRTLPGFSRRHRGYGYVATLPPPYPSFLLVFDSELNCSGIYAYFVRYISFYCVLFIESTIAVR